MVSARTSDELEDELDAIRLRLYEEIRDMTPEEEAAYINAQAAPIIKKYNMQIATLKPVQPKRRALVSSE